MARQKSFDTLVKEAKDEMPKKYIPKQRARRDINYQVPSEHSNESWPTKFFYPPKVGDLIQSKSGVTLEIKDIVHIMGVRILIRLGKLTGGSKAFEGSGVSGKDPMEF